MKVPVVKVEGKIEAGKTTFFRNSKNHYPVHMSLKSE